MCDASDILCNLQSTPSGTIVELYGPTGCGKTQTLMNLYHDGGVFLPGILYTGTYDVHSLRAYDGSRFVAFDNSEYLFNNKNGELKKPYLRAIADTIHRGGIALLLTTGHFPLANEQSFQGLVTELGSIPQLLAIAMPSFYPGLVRELEEFPNRDESTL
jgi:hypothetical protein